MGQTCTLVFLSYDLMIQFTRLRLSSNYKRKELINKRDASDQNTHKVALVNPCVVIRKPRIMIALHHFHDEKGEETAGHFSLKSHVTLMTGAQADLHHNDSKRDNRSCLTKRTPDF